jgi:hypothetical protein
MKYYEIKALSYHFTFLLLLVTMISCRSKQVQSSKFELQKEHEIMEEVQKNNVIETSIQKEFNENQIQELLTVISSLNINFEGKTLEDKLDVLLKRTPEGGTNLSFSGVGSASFKQDEKIDFSKLEKSLHMRQDSLFVDLFNKLSLKQEQINEQKQTKDKNLQVKGFLFEGYLILGLIVLFLVLLWWLKRKFKVFS